MSTFWSEYPEIEEKLIFVKNNMLEKSKSSEKYLDRSFEYLYSTGGKMLRPAFIIIGSLFMKQKLNEEKDKLIKDLASAVEMLHTATLVHDDVIDDSFLRRGKEAIHSKYSKEYAVYMGDYLFSESFLILSDYNIPRDVMKNLAQGISTICKAEMLQNHYRYDSKVSVEEYLKVISGKTAALFGISLSLGANQVGIEEEKTNKLYEIGNNIGLAFQITDDILDFTSDEKNLGKEVKSDIIRGYYTLPLLLAFHSENKDELQKIFEKDNMNESDLDQVFEIVRKSGAIEESKKHAKKYIDKATNELDKFEDTKGKQILKAILPKILKRSY